MSANPNRKPPLPATAGAECCRGAVIGAANGILLALAGGLHTPGALLASAAGASLAGALVALLVWSGSAAAPEAPVPPPPPRHDRR
ncbi:MAG TPA: hypothetical protein VF801_02390 [Rhodocyclaceae bacterium]